MAILRAVTCGGEEKLAGKEVAIRDGKIACCPGCAASEIPVTENVEFGLMFIMRHDMPPIVGTTVVQCDYSCEPLKIIEVSNNTEPEAVLH